VLKRLGAGHLLIGTGFLVMAGLVMVYSASAVRAELKHASSLYFALRQLGGVAIGVALAAGIAFAPRELLRKSGFPMWLLACALLAATVFSPLGAEVNGARRWLNVNGGVVQPLEFAKLAMILVLAQWFSIYPQRIADLRVALLFPGALALIPIALLLRQPDFGGALMIAIFTGVLIFTAGARVSHLALVGAVVLPLLLFLGGQEGYRLDRVRAFIDPQADPTGTGYQLIQSLLSFGAGGLFGVGLGGSQQKLFFLPEAHTDFILSVLAEEAGLVGVLVVLATFLLVGLASLAIAARARDLHSMLLASGASLMIWLQGLLNAGVAMGLLPTKGTTLPLFSYGRSSLIASLVAVGLVLHAARSERGGWR
jgi:cell division protein FtsW